MLDIWHSVMIDSVNIELLKNFLYCVKYHQIFKLDGANKAKRRTTNGVVDQTWNDMANTQQDSWFGSRACRWPMPDAKAHFIVTVILRARVDNIRSAGSQQFIGEFLAGWQYHHLPLTHIRQSSLPIPLVTSRPTNNQLRWIISSAVQTSNGSIYPQQCAIYLAISLAFNQHFEFELWIS